MSQPIRSRRGPVRVILSLLLIIPLLPALLPRARADEGLLVSVGGPPDDPAYLPVYVAAALGTFTAEGVAPVIMRAKHPTAAITALREREAQVAVTTLDQAIRGAWVRGTPVRLLVAHTRAPAAALLVSATARGRVARVEDLRGQRVGMPGPGTTGHLLLAALLRRARLEPWQVEIQSLGGTALASRLGSGNLAAAVLDEPWASRALAAGSATVLVDFRRPDEAARHLGGPFYEVVSVVLTSTPDGPRSELALAGFARALIRVQAWLAATAPATVAERLPPSLVGDRDGFVTRLAAVQSAYAPDGEATDAGLAASLSVLRGGSPWPATLKVTPADLREPRVVSDARARLGLPPPAP